MKLRTLSFVVVLAICLETFTVGAMEALAARRVSKKSNPKGRAEKDGDGSDGKEPPKGLPAPKKKKAAVAVPTGYVYMNVLGPYTTPGLAVVKIGKASPHTLADRMRVENNAARQLGVQGQWPFGGGAHAEASTDRWRDSFNPATARNAIPYVKTFSNLNAAETAVRDAWAHTDQAMALNEAESLAWFASVARVHDPNPLRGSIADFGATQELVAVRWSAIAHVVAAGQAAGEAGWTLDACLEAIAGYAAPAGHPEATPAGWGPQGAAAQVRVQAHNALYAFEQYLHAELGNVNAGKPGCLCCVDAGTPTASPTGASSPTTSSATGRRSAATSATGWATGARRLMEVPGSSSSVGKNSTVF